MVLSIVKKGPSSRTHRPSSPRPKPRERRPPSFSGPTWYAATRPGSVSPRGARKTISPNSLWNPPRKPRLDPKGRIREASNIRNVSSTATTLRPKSLPPGWCRHHKPVVTDWDYSPPQQDEREVGTCAVTPTEDGVTAQNQGRVEVPGNVKERLRAEADETGEAVSTTTTLRYQHDLDTRATQSRVPRPSVAERAAALRERSQRQGQKDGELSPQYQKILEKLTQQREQKTQQRRRSSSNRLKESQGYSLPQIVVVQEAAPSTRRFGGL